MNIHLRVAVKEDCVRLLELVNELAPSDSEPIPDRAKKSRGP